MKERFASVLRFVTEHNLLVLVLMLLLSAGVVTGVSDLKMQRESNGSEAIGDTEVAQDLEYMQDRYGGDDNETTGATAAVYVRDDGNALSKSALLESLRYQQTVRENESVATALGDDGRVIGVANVVATRLAGSPDATLDEQIAALESASETEVREAVEASLSSDSPALGLLPSDYEPGSATAESHRMVFQFDADADEETVTAATKTLHDEADAREDPEFFTTGQHASAAITQQSQENMVTLILPVALAIILAVLAFSYRDVVDVLVGFTGVVLSVLWMFGILGWLQIPAGITTIIGPVLIVGLSVDFGLHVFTRYREERGPDEGIREPMLRGLSGVAVALALVALTAGIGFMSNVTNDFVVIRELSIGITLGVVSAFVLSITLVPALKVTIDDVLERVGLDRRKRPLGDSRLLRPILGSASALARRAAPAVIVVALVAGAAGGAAWTGLDREVYQEDTDGAAEWKQELPGPLAWEVTEEERQSDYVDEHYRSADEDSQRQSALLVRGDVTDPAALQSLADAREELSESDVVYERGGDVGYVSPVTVMQSVAAQDEQFAEVYRDADTDGDGVPDENLAGVYDALYEAAPDRAATVIERTDGEYRSVRMLVPIDTEATTNEQADAIADVAASADESSDAVSVAAVGEAVLVDAELRQTTDSILQTLAIALGAISAFLLVVYRAFEGTATLGALTAVPIAVVVGLVFGGMYVLDVPLTANTALLLSLVVGLGVDYNIHVSDRFAQELSDGRGVRGALSTAIYGTGGALFGSTLTSVGAFSALLLHPAPTLQSFGILVVLALALSFVVAVFVLPSLLTLWARRVHGAPAERGATSAGPVSQD